MIHGFRLMQFTYLHVFLSVIGLGAGVFVELGFLSSKNFSILTTAFLVATLLTSLSGFLFPVSRCHAGNCSWNPVGD
jgi:uncharacterized transporter YbjL